MQSATSFNHLRDVKVAIVSQLERSCHRRKRTETALKPRTYALSWKLSELSSHTSLRTLTDKWRHTEELYHHPLQAREPSCAWCLLSVYHHPTVQASRCGPNWSLHTSLPIAACMAMGDVGSWMGSIAYMAETPHTHMHTHIMLCMDTGMHDTEMPPHSHMHIIYMWQLRIENADYFGS